MLSNQVRKALIILLKKNLQNKYESLLIISSNWLSWNVPHRVRFYLRYIVAMTSKDMGSYTISDYQDLIETIIYHNDLYYDQSISEISDVEYDHLFAILKEVEALRPDWISPQSPTQSLKSQFTKQSEFKKATHANPLLSLDNTYNAEDINDWYDSISRMLSKTWQDSNNLSFVIEPKYDGISVELIYKDGKFVQAITRGDGIIWEDITANVATISSLPKTIPHLQEIHFRGEIVMPKSIFEKINIEKAANNEALFANPRNAASGSIKQLDPTVTANRGLVCYVYEII